MESLLAPTDLEPEQPWRCHEERGLDPLTGVFDIRPVICNLMWPLLASVKGSQAGQIICKGGYVVKWKFCLTILSGPVNILKSKQARVMPRSSGRAYGTE